MPVQKNSREDLEERLEKVTNRLKFGQQDELEAEMLAKEQADLEVRISRLRKARRKWEVVRW
jgi:hypothetical protein